MMDDESEAVWGSSAYMRSYVAAWAKARPDLDIEALQVTSWMAHTVHIVENRVEQAAATEGIKGGEVSVLLALRRRPGMQASPTTLSRTLWVTSGGMTYRVDRLLERGLVTRLPHPEDRRSFNIELTPAGVAVADRLQGMINSIEVEAVSGLDAKERELFLRLLQKIHAAAESIGGKKTAAD